ncbi:MAG: YdcF family protein [Xanthomonadaceae bacterium]|nr:YdcF family protein [Xanthomonadaceae bacterium]
MKIIKIARVADITTADRSTLVVLGMSLQGDRIGADYRKRLERACKLYTEGGVRRILVLGGPSGDGSASEADRGRDYLQSRGVPVQDVLVENKSLDTLENLRNARNVLLDSGGRRFVLITSRYHLARSHRIAQGLGMNPVLCGAEDELSFTPRIMIRFMLEAYFLHWYQVGAGFSKLLGWRRGLARIS